MRGVQGNKAGVNEEGQEVQSEVWAHILLPGTCPTAFCSQTQSKRGLKVVKMGDGTKRCPKATPLVSYTMGCSNCKFGWGAVASSCALLEAKNS